MNRIYTTLVGFTLAATFTGQAYAGSLGATSTDTSVISLEVVDRVQITGVNDIVLGSYSGVGTLNGATGYCVHRNGGDDYTVKLTTDTGAFKVTSATTLEDIVFTAKVDSDPDASDGTPIAYNTASSAMPGSAQLDCGGTDNGAIEVSFAQADLLAASTGSDYTATMTILVEPI